MLDDELLTELESVIERIASDVQEDVRRPYGMQTFYDAIERARSFVVEQPVWLADRLDCHDDGSERDGDGDGFGGCSRDCDDDDASIHPGAEEVCDSLDKDCDGYVDDSIDCPCPVEMFGGEPFALCAFPRSQPRALSHCQAHGQTLAYFDDLEQNTDVFRRAIELVYDAWWIGLNDLESEGEYLWSNGEAPDFDNWHPGEPAGGGAADCVWLKIYSEGTWRQADCGGAHPFICRQAEEDL